MFNFFSNTYSAVVTIFAALLGISFPLILQSIQRIDEKYDSAVLSNRFEDENIYHIFKWLLYVYAVIVCVVPFILSFLSNVEKEYWVNSFLLLYLLCIIMTLVILFDRISKYYNIEKLLSYLSSKKKESDILIFWDIMRLASKAENEYLYKTAIIEVLGYFVKEQKDSKDKEIVYSASLYQVLYEMGSAVGISQQQSFIYKRNDIISILYDTIITNANISQQTFNHIWFMLNNASFVSNTNWLKTYWTYANQYMRFRKMKCDNEDEQEYLKKFYIFNVMFGAMLTYHRNYSTLNYIMTFSQSLPLSFPLIPGTFSKIIDCVENISNMNNQWITPMVLESKYSIKGLDEDVNASNEIAKNAYKYLSLLFIRLWSYKDYNINYSEPLEIPYIGNSINKNEQLIKLSKTIREYIDTWYSSGELNNLGLWNLPSKSDVLALLDNYISSLEDMNIELDKQNGYDEERLDYICNDFLKFNAQNYIEIPTQEELPCKENSRSTMVEVIGAIDVERRFLQKGRSEILGGVGDILASRLDNRLKHIYLQYLICSFTIEERKVQLDNLISELDSLQLTKDDCIIEIDYSSDLRTAAKVFRIMNHFHESVFVCKIADLPSLDIIDSSSISTEKKIDPYNNIYLGVEELSDKYILSVKQSIRINQVNGKPKAFLFTIER
ncbi:hypothetical protein [Segatella salivae]|jgi:hypothetical protein|uniref:hypothetical protein n=1 Tax=Segatella salivae TaxID=228604 RepID=UPI001CAD3DDE|nr:hypothetical protein [Segatella salivae]MBF1585500.1 hypothetical protein [Prevotella sp.]